MAKNENAPKTVQTATTEANILPNIGTLSLEDRAKLFAMLKSDVAVVTQANSEIEAEVKRLTARNEELRESVKPINDEIAANVLRIKTLTGKSVNVSGDGERTRVSTPCTDYKGHKGCGNARHGSLLKGCPAYNARLLDKQAEATATA